MKVIAVHVDRCAGCRTCELYCAVERGSEGKSLLKAVQEKPLPQARVRVEGEGDTSFPLHCRHCLEAPCLSACLSGALTRDPRTGMVVVQEDRCIACWTCAMFCPYGVIYPWPERKMALKCDRCAHMAEGPVCALVCPTEALEVVELDDLEHLYREKRRQALHLAASGEGLAVLDLSPVEL